MKILITGASGFVGGHIAHMAAQLPDMTVLCGRRDGATGSVHLDLLDRPSVMQALQDVEAVIHCAVGNRQVTVDGTRMLLECARQCGVRRVVHISSIAVYGAAQGSVTEATPCIAPTGRGYAAWKVAAEDLCLQARGLEVVRLRPTIVYSPDSPLWVEGLVRRIRSGWWGTFGAAGEGTCNPVHVADVARAALAAVHVPQAAGMAFNINGADTLSWNDWFRQVALAAGEPPLVPVAAMRLKLWRLAALPFRVIRRVAPRYCPSWVGMVPADSEMALFGLHATYPVTLAQTVLGWTPQVSLQEGMRAITAHYARSVQGNVEGNIVQ